MASRVETEMAVIATAMGASTFTFYGRSEEARHGAPPKITWVEDDDETFEPPQRQQSRAAETCVVRKIPLAIHVWGTSTENSETLYEALLSALVTAYTRHSFELMASPKRGEARTTLGHKRVLRVNMLVAVERSVLTAGDLDTVTATGKASGDGGATYQTGVTMTDEEDP